MAAVACGCSEQLVCMHDLTVGRVLLGIIVVSYSHMLGELPDNP